MSDPITTTGLTAHPARPAAGYPHVQGRCPACGTASLFLASGGHVTCAVLSCPDPSRADAVLRVLAEHGDTQQVREQVEPKLLWQKVAEALTATQNDTEQIRQQIANATWMPGLILTEPQRIALVGAVMAVVAPIVAARDAAAEQLERSLAAQELMATQFRTMQQEKEHGWRESERWEARAERAEADLAALREFIHPDQGNAATPYGDGERYVAVRDIEQVLRLDAPGRPAGHDESGQ